MGTFVATLLEVKNVGGGIFDVKVNYANAQTRQSLDRVYPTSPDTYARTEDFLTFIASEVAKLNAANGVLYEVLGMVGQQIG